MEFEYDPKKSEANQQKHGISFEEAKVLWSVPGITLMAKNQDEVRFMRTGLIQERCFSCFFTMRDLKIRLISVRRSREKEIMDYQRSVKIYEKKEEDHSG